MDTVTTRRGLLGVMAAIPALTIAAPAAASAKAAAAIRPEFARLIATAKEADEAVQRHHVDVYEPAKLRYDMAKDAVPHITLTPNMGWRGDPAFWSTDRPDTMQLARSLVSICDERSDVLLSRELLAAEKKRDEAIVQASHSTGLAQAISDSDALGEQSYRALADITDFPVVSIAEMEAKVALMVERDAFDHVDVPDILLADLRRIGGAA